MRCPKCGFITFDHLETCTKCGKDISAVSEQLSGTVLKAVPPVFLKITPPSDEEKTDLSSTDDVDVEFSMEDDDLVVVEESADMDFDLMEEENGETASSEVEPTNDFDFRLDDDSAQLELSTDDDTKELEPEEGAQLDFNELDISDLAPPETAQETPSEELTLENDDRAVAASGRSGAHLEDLQTDDLDLDTLSPQSPGKMSQKILRPSVKTGTALDDFDIDLGDLISKQ
jgi:hypothetical protein